MNGPIMSATGLLVLAFACRASGDDTSILLRDQYPKAVGALQRSLRAFSAEGKKVGRFFDGSVLTVGSLRLAASGERRVVVRQQMSLDLPEGDEPVPGSIVRCVTPEYTFELGKNSESAPYVIRSYDPKAGTSSVAMRVDHDFGVSVLCMTHFNGYSLLSRIQSPAFVLTKADRMTEGDTEIVRMDYTWESDRGFESGSVYLDPARKWAIRRSDISYVRKSTLPSPNGAALPGELDPPIQLQTEVIYQELADGTPFPARTVSTVRLPDPSKVQQDVLDIKRITLGEPPAEWFKLSGYGLPDVPLQPVSRPSSFSLRNPWLWGSLVTALVSFGLLRCLRRKSATSSAG